MWPCALPPGLAGSLAPEQHTSAALWRLNNSCAACSVQCAVLTALSLGVRCLISFLWPHPVDGRPVCSVCSDMPPLILQLVAAHLIVVLPQRACCSHCPILREARRGVSAPLAEWQCARHTLPARATSCAPLLMPTDAGWLHIVLCKMPLLYAHCQQCGCRTALR